MPTTSVGMAPGWNVDHFLQSSVAMDDGVSKTDILIVTPRDLVEVFKLKHGDSPPTGRRVQRRLKFGFSRPTDHYEALVNKCVSAETLWLDVGAGRAPFPYNLPLAGALARRARLLVGVDPDNNIDSNPFLHERAKCRIEDYHSDRLFDLATLRMVVEHVEEPPKLFQALHRLLRRSGRVIVFTVNAWAPLSIVARVLPFRLHYPIKRFFWGGDETDTFPTVFRMNTRRQLKRLSAECGFKEVYFSYLPDAGVFTHFGFANYLELSLWDAFRRCGWRYPENCLLGVYEKN